MPSLYVADIETDGLDPKTIWMVGILDIETDEYTAYVGDVEVPLGLMRLAEADLVVGHNFRRFDAPQIERLTEGLVKLDDEKIIDTLELSRVLFPELPRHGLAHWGEIFGYPKLEYKDFGVFKPEMVPYCERDVRLNKLVYDFLISQLPEEDDAS